MRRKRKPRNTILKTNNDNVDDDNDNGDNFDDDNGDNVDDDNGENVDDDNGENVDDDNGENVDEDNGDNVDDDNGDNVDDDNGDNVDDDNGENVDEDNGDNVDDDNGDNVDEDNGNTAISSQYFQGETKSQSNGDNSKAGHEGDEIPDNSFIESKRNNVYDILKDLKLRNVNRLVIGNLNINSIASKFDQLKAIIQCHVDILVIVETKLDITFPTSQFLLDGFSKPYRLDRNRNGGGILIYVREDIPSKLLLKHNFPDDIDGIFIEINLRKIKWLLFGTYHPPSQADNYYFDSITRALDIYGRIVH